MKCSYNDIEVVSRVDPDEIGYLRGMSLPQELHDQHETHITAAFNTYSQAEVTVRSLIHHDP